MSGLPESLDVDGMLLADSNIKLIGRAKRCENGFYSALADVNGQMCLVEVRVTVGPAKPKEAK